VSVWPEKRRTWWALTAEEMQECRWLKPVRVAQIDFREWTPDGHLRHPSFVGVRDDKAARSTTRKVAPKRLSDDLTRPRQHVGRYCEADLLRRF
jgi:bifunctional non-homologous end joining protein LigD